MPILRRKTKPILNITTTGPDPFLYIRRGKVDELRNYLEEDRSRIKKCRPNTGFTMLHRASELGDSDSCTLLLEFGADVNAWTGWGRYTPLHIALGNGWLQTAYLLLNHGANADKVNKAGETAVEYARKRGHIEAAADFTRTLKDREQRKKKNATIAADF